MRAYSRIIVGIISCILLAGGAYLWAYKMAESIYTYRSPLSQNPPIPGPALGQPLTRQFVFLILDALREDTSLSTDIMPTLNKLRQQGAWATMHSRPPSYSETSYTTLLTGAWPEINDGPAFNLIYSDIPTFTQDDIFSAAHRAGLTTAISAYDWYEKLVPQGAVTSGFYTTGDDQFADRQVVDAALPWLKSRNFHLILIHMDQIDYAGHYEGGPLKEEWNAAAQRVDKLVSEIVSTLDFSMDTLFICSDHGQTDQGGHGGHDLITLIEPFILVGAGVKPGHYNDVQMVDVAPTASALLGTNIPASSQGNVLMDMLVLSADQYQKIVTATQVQQNQLLQAYFQSISQTAPLGSGSDIVSKTQAAMQEAHSTRLNAERVPRGIASLLIALLPLLVLVIYIRWKHLRWQTITWLLGGALIYIAVFNLRYAILDKRTYSFSTISLEVELISYITITTFIALVVGWVFSLIVLKAFQKGTFKAVETTVGMNLMVIYLLAVPVLWNYILNGALITWTLPELGVFYLALLALIQIIIVAGVGIIFSGVAVLVVRPINRRPAI